MFDCYHPSIGGAIRVNENTVVIETVPKPKLTGASLTTEEFDG